MLEKLAYSQLHAWMSDYQLKMHLPVPAAQVLVICVSNGRTLQDSALRAEKFDTSGPRICRSAFSFHDPEIVEDCHNG